MSPPSRRILIVDDNEDAAESLGTLLRLDGHETRASFSSREALHSALSFKPDIAFLDIGLPEIDGYELARQMRGLPVKPVELAALKRALMMASARGDIEVAGPASRARSSSSRNG